MKVPKKWLTRAQLKRSRADGDMSAETLAFYEKLVKREEARKRRAEAKKSKARLTAVLSLCPTSKRHPNAAPVKPRGFVDPILSRDGFRPTTRTKRRSPRRGLAKFGITL